VYRASVSQDLVFTILIPHISAKMPSQVPVYATFHSKLLLKLMRSSARTMPTHQDCYIPVESFNPIGIFLS